MLPIATENNARRPSVWKNRYLHVHALPREIRLLVVLALSVTLAAGLIILAVGLGPGLPGASVAGPGLSLPGSGSAALAVPHLLIIFLYVGAALLDPERCKIRSILIRWTVY